MRRWGASGASVEVVGLKGRRIEAIEQHINNCDKIGEKGKRWESLIGRVTKVQNLIWVKLNFAP